MSPEVAWAITVPLVGAILCLGARRGAGRWVAGLTAAGALGASAVVARNVFAGRPLRHFVGGWGASLGIDLHADGVAALMLAAVGVVGAVITAQSIRDLPTSARSESFFSLWFFAWAALNALVLSADVFNLYVTLELTTLAAVALIAASGDREALRAGLRYLLIALPGSLAYLLGVAILYGAYATLDLATLGARLTPSSTTAAALALMAVGLCLKAALFPLHAWLPPAYVGARPDVSALLSALIGKGPFYVLLRLWLEVVPVEHGHRVGLLLGVLGAAGVIWGAVLALKQQRLRALVAYSSIGQIGYLFLLFPLGSAQALSGALYLAASHAAAAASMFLATGTIHRTLGHDRVDELNGLAHHLPVTFFSLALAGVSLMGMPPSGGFVAKWLLVRASIEARQWWLTAVILAGGLLAAAYVFRVLRGAFLPLPREAHLHSIPRGAEIAALVLALIALLLGVAPAAPLALLDVGRPS